MSPNFNCIATGIGSLTIIDPDKATSLVLHYLPEAPTWPQLPERTLLEHFCAQFSEGLPGMVVGRAQERLSADTSRDLSSDREQFYIRYLAKCIEHFRIAEDNASGFYTFVAALQKNGLPPRARFLKGHCTGPLTFGITVKNEAGRDVAYNEILFDAVAKGFAM
jgi:hypothetical protein